MIGLSTFFARLPPNARGIVATCLAMLGFIGTDGCIKFVSDELSISQMIVMRGVIILIFLIAIGRFTGGLDRLPGLKDRVVFLRAAAECSATLLYYQAITRVPIANANAVLQIIPLLIVAAAALFLGEKVGWRRWLAILTGFCGVMLVVQPCADAFQGPIVFALGAALFYSFRDLSTRFIDNDLSAVSINLVTSSCVILMGVVLIPFQDWHIPSIQSIAVLALAASFLTMAYIAVTVAMRTGDVSASAPFRYSIVVWALLIDVIIFANIPSALTIIGILITVGSGLYLIFRERAVQQVQNRDT
ncbi:MAG: DMT family transporter [Pseudomonadota bacterium]